MSGDAPAGTFAAVKLVHPRWRLLAILVGVVCANGFVGGIAGLVTATEPVGGFVALATFAPVGGFVAWRYARVRVVIDGAGVAVVGLFGTTRVAPADVWGFELEGGRARGSPRLVRSNGARSDVSALMKLGEAGMRSDETTARLVEEANAAISRARGGA